MPAVTYNLTAVNVPAPQVPATYIDPAGGPAILRPLTSGLSMVADWAFDMGHVEALGRLGAGVYGVAFGMDLSSADAGLVGDVAAGAALLDVEVMIGAITVSGGLATNTDNYVWVSRGGTASKRTTADGASMLLPPDTAQPWVYRGLMHKDGSNNTTIIDYSGVCFIRGGVLWRRTADLGMPGDTPPSSALLLTRTLGGLWLWDGGQYACVDGSTLPVSSPSQITANQNDYAISASASLLRLSTNASRNVTGLASGWDGRRVVIVNVGSFNLVLKHQDAGSAAANRLLMAGAADVTLAGDASVTLVWDAVTGRWRQVV